VKIKWHGVFNVMVTPFCKNGNINFESFKNNLDFSVEEKADGVIIAGSTGEFYNLEDRERIKLFAEAKERVGEKLTVIGCCSSLSSTFSSIKLIKEAQKTGIDGMMLLPPIFVHPNHNEILDYFYKVSQHCDLPIIVYNNPVRTGVFLDTKIMEQLVNTTRVVAIKDSSKDITYLANIKRKIGDKLQIFTGFDTLFLPSMAVGANGVVSMAFQIVGHLIKDIYLSFVKGELEKAMSIQSRILPLYEAMYSGSSAPYCVIKYAMNCLGYGGGYPRLPLHPADEKSRKAINSFLSDSGLKN